MIRHFLLLLIFFTSFLFISCGGKKIGHYDQLTKNAPSWVTKGDGAFSTPKGTSLHGVGVANFNPNVALQRQIADSRARKGIAETLNTYVGSFLKDFMQSHMDYVKPEEASSVEYVSSITKSITDVTLIGVRIIDRWMDPKSNLYSLASLSYDDVAAAIKDKVEESVRMKKAAFLAEKSDEAMKMLNQELDKRRITP